MKKNDRKMKKKRALAMTHKERVFMLKVRHGLAKNESVKTLAEACRQLGKHIANVRRAVLEQSKGEEAQKTRAEILKMAGIKEKTKAPETTTGEPS